MTGISPSCANQLALSLLTYGNPSVSLTYIYSSLEHAAFHGVQGGRGVRGIQRGNDGRGRRPLADLSRLLRGSCPVSVWWDRRWKFSVMIWMREASPLCLHMTSQLHVASTKNVAGWHISLGRQTLHLQVQSFKQISEHKVRTASALETARLNLYAWIIGAAYYKHGVEFLRPGDSDAVDLWVGLGIYILTPHPHPQYIWHRRVGFFCLVYQSFNLIGFKPLQTLLSWWQLKSQFSCYILSYNLDLATSWKFGQRLYTDLRLPSLALLFTEFPIILQWPCLPTKVPIVKAMIFPVVMCKCESWTIKKAERWRTDAFKLWC